ncbi:hypothetical protein A2U01_0051168, partial [Trifolium medium]|nr:hypothetical protein [Trifolium medium]
GGMAHCAGYQGFRAGCFGFLRNAQIHVVCRASLFVHPARCARGMARCASAKSIKRKVIFRSRVGLLKN